MNNASSIVRRYYDHHPHYYCTPLPLCSTAQLCTTAIAQHLRYYDIFAISRNMPHLLHMISTEFCYQIRNDLSNIPKSCAPSLETYCCHIHQKEVYTNMGQIACSDSQTLTSQQSSPIEKHSFTAPMFFCQVTSSIQNAKRPRKIWASKSACVVSELLFLEIPRGSTPKLGICMKGVKRYMLLGLQEVNSFNQAG